MPGQVWNLPPCLNIAVAPAKPSTWAVRIKNAQKVATLKNLLAKLRENPKAEGVGGSGWDAA